MNEQDVLKFKDLSTEEKTKRGILGTLFGPIASVVKSTRNGRKYPDEVWEKVFDDPIVKEMLNAGGIPGELDHPTDRTETCSEKIAIMMPEAPKKDDSGHLVARFDIIDTPMGRIASALAKYGFKFGISSRGTGDTYEDYDGEDTVDADTYDFQAFDLVLLPACEDARLRLAESFDVKKLKLRKELKEAFESATDSEKKIMSETLNNLEIDYKNEDDIHAKENGEDINGDESGNEAADDVRATLMDELQQSMRTQKELETKVKELQEKLSVCYAKEARYIEALTRAQGDTQKATSNSESLKREIESLNESLELEKKHRTNSNDRSTRIREALDLERGKVTSLTESLAKKDSEITKLTESITSLKEKHKKECLKLTSDNKKLTSDNEKLQESLEESQKDLKITRSQSSAKLAKATELTEKYKGIARVAVDKYIALQATRLGVSPEDIKKRLNEGYSFNDIDKACEDLQGYKLNLNSLPFNVRNGAKVRTVIKESKETITPICDDGADVDDDVDESLRIFIN